MTRTIVIASAAFAAGWTARGVLADRRRRERRALEAVARPGLRGLEGVDAWTAGQLAAFAGRMSDGDTVASIDARVTEAGGDEAVYHSCRDCGVIKAVQAPVQVGPFVFDRWAPVPDVPDDVSTLNGEEPE